MRSKRHQRLLIVALLLAMLALAGGAAAQQVPDPSVNPTNDGGTYYANVGEDVHIFWVWFSLNPGLVRTYLGAAHESYTLLDADGNVVASISDAEAENYWSPIVQLPGEVIGFECSRPRLAGSVFEYSLGTLAAGTYTLVLESTLDRPVSDGLHVCTFNGQQVSPPPSLFGPGTTTSTVTLVVED